MDALPLLNWKYRQVLLLPLTLMAMESALAQEQEQRKGFEVYGFVKADAGYNFDQSDPDWFDVLRVTKLPSYEDEFAPDGKIYFGVRQTRMGFNSWTPTSLGRLKLNFEFDLFGVGADVGQTTFHFRRAFIELGRFTVGQTESLFTDADVTPNTLDFGAPPSRAFLRSVQLRYMVTAEKFRWGLALEQPGAISDDGIYRDRIELENVRPHFQLPDLTAQYRRIMGNGYLEAAGVLKWIKWENTAPSSIDLSGDEVGWGLYLSTTQRLGDKTSFKGQVVTGKGMENYLTDGGPDIGIQTNFGSASTPLLGVSLPVMGGLAFLEHNWSDKWSSTAGYSNIRIDNSDAQADDAFKSGHYATGNLLYMPIPQLQAGLELQWGKRNNFRDDFSSSATRIQFSCKYSFSFSAEEKKE
ncbi:porin-like protein [Arcticibacter pallidicorallinus]|uniref:Porin-like protein n=1 Tax=Arcticibacter pallidicorallinus TaxID=1259464 RepID=A0A2T0UBJ1_9SPHI|nr:DcaP family trimeric outer membrane transporter [Arcticibacter pallidicorallinus]PRY55262.1 porin-like protein [Arcticibacter pallidicorallinus]